MGSSSRSHNTRCCQVSLSRSPGPGPSSEPSWRLLGGTGGGSALRECEREGGREREGEDATRAAVHKQVGKECCVCLPKLCF